MSNRYIQPKISASICITVRIDDVNKNMSYRTTPARLKHVLSLLRNGFAFSREAFGDKKGYSNFLLFCFLCNHGLVKDPYNMLLEIKEDFTLSASTIIYTYTLNKRLYEEAIRVLEKPPAYFLLTAYGKALADLIESTWETKLQRFEDDDLDLIITYVL